MKWLITFIVLILFTEVYSFIGAKHLASGNKYGYWFYIAYAVSLLLLISFFVGMFYNFSQKNYTSTSLKNFFFGFVFSLFIAKLVFASFMFFGDVVRGGFWVKDWLLSNKGAEGFSPSRKKFIAQLSLAIAAIPFASFVYGITKGKYNFEIKNIPLGFNDLPKAFDGLKIVQISDIHVGSFDDPSEVARGIEMVNNLNPDVILFTGDLVNNRASEMASYVHLFSELKAKHGKFSVLGNHDYGDYVPFSGAEEKEKNLMDLFSFHKEMGFELLNNEHRKLEIDGQSIVIAGVENWGLPPFPQYGDIHKTFENISDEDFVVLMSHDPSHWDAEIIPHKKHVHLTLSGHTHGMQFGVDIPGFKWSPVKYRYPRWSGLYSDNNQHLYVNKGFGFIGFPGRVGMWPEITLFELRHSS
jgi:predicted MPP superfamily phosphohydrolase